MMAHKTIQAVRRAVWAGFKANGTLNGIPAVRDEYTPFRSQDDTPLTCYHEQDGSEVWRHVGMGSV